MKLGFIAFGGPAAHIAMMEEEVVRRRGWMTRQHFLDLVGATNLIPGPNSTEMGLHVGYERAGPGGLAVAGICFIGPAVLVTGIFAWLYVEFGTLPRVEPFLYGVKPAVLVLVLVAVWRLGRRAITGPRLAVLGVAVLAAVLAGVGEVSALLGGGVVGAIWTRLSDRRPPSDDMPGTDRGERRGVRASSFAGILPISILAAPLVQTAAAGVPLHRLGLFFLKVGAVLYGSGYVLIAFLRGDLVDRFGWLTEAQLLDAIAIGQFTPGPILSTATFVGYVLEGVPGAAVATLGIFLPSFLFVLILNPLVPRLRDHVWTAAFLDAVNVAAVALMLAVTLQLGASSLTTWPAWVIAGIAGVAAWRFDAGPVWLIAGGALVGRVLAVWADPI